MHMYYISDIDEKLIRVIDLGPFKHRVDDGIIYSHIETRAKTFLTLRLFISIILCQLCICVYMCLWFISIPGLPIRKAAYQALDSIHDSCPHRLDMSEFIRQVRKGLNDTDDIQILSYQILDKIALWQGAALLETLDELPPLVMKGVKEKLKEAKQTETSEKHGMG